MQVMENNCDEAEYYGSFPIKYCPFCGKKLI